MRWRSRIRTFTCQFFNQSGWLGSRYNGWNLRTDTRMEGQTGGQVPSKPSLGRQEWYLSRQSHCYFICIKHANCLIHCLILAKRYLSYGFDDIMRYGHQRNYAIRLRSNHVAPLKHSWFKHRFEIKVKAAVDEMLTPTCWPRYFICWPVYIVWLVKTTKRHLHHTIKCWCVGIDCWMYQVFQS